MKKCFVVSPIGKNGSDVRHRSDGFLDEVIRPVAEAAGYEVSRADEDKAPGMVTESIINKIIDADLVIVDLHGHNPNVMYEVAVRHATGKPLVQMIEHDENLPFDIGGINTVMYDPSVRGLRQWRADLQAAIASSETSGTSNPVVRAGLMRTLGKQESPVGDILQIVLGEVEAVRNEVRASRRVSPVSPKKVSFDSDKLDPVAADFIARQVEIFAQDQQHGDFFAINVLREPLTLVLRDRVTEAQHFMRLLPPPDENENISLDGLLDDVATFMKKAHRNASIKRAIKSARSSEESGK